MAILSHNRIALLFVAFTAATGPASGTRNLKSSSMNLIYYGDIIVDTSTPKKGLLEVFLEWRPRNPPA